MRGLSLLRRGPLVLAPSRKRRATQQTEGQVVFLTPSFEPSVGGIVRQTGLQARALQGRGWDVAVVTNPVQGEPRRALVGGLAVHRVGRGGEGRSARLATVLATAWWLVRRRSRIAVLHVVMDPDLVLSAALAALLRRTVMNWVTDGDASAALRRDSQRARVQAVIHLAVLRRVRHVALTDRMRQELAALRVLGSDTRVIPVPVDPQFRRPDHEERQAARAALQIADGARVLVYVGHLEKRKGVSNLVQAVAAADGPELLLIVGAGRGGDVDTERELRAMVEEMRLVDRVRFLGERDDVRSVLWASDIFVLPSEREGMPNSLLEAMACGLVCVAPASAGGDVLLRDGAGVVPTSNRPEDLRRALDPLEDDRIRRELAAQAVSRVEQFSLRSVVEQSLELYTSITQQDRCAPARAVGD